MALFKKLDYFETAVLTITCDKILERVNAINKTLEMVELNMIFGVQFMTLLVNFIESVRSSFDNIKLQAKNLITKSEQCRYKDESKRIKKRKVFIDERNDNDAKLLG